MSVRSRVRSAGARVAGPVLYRLAVLAGGPPPGLRRGDGAAPRDVPVVLVVLGDSAAASPGPVVDGLRLARARADDHTPVVVVGAPVLAPYRRAGYVVELLPDRDRAAGMDELRRTYATTSEALLDAAPSAEDVSRAVLAARPRRRRGPVAVGRRGLRRAEVALTPRRPG